MAKICPYTGEKVLYLDCLECEDRGKCSEIHDKNLEQTKDAPPKTT